MPDAPEVLETRLATLLADPPATTAFERTTRRIRRRRRLRRSAAGVATVLLVVLVAVGTLHTTGDDAPDTDRVTTEPEPPDAPSVVREEDGFPAAPGWHRLADPPGPSRQDDARAWTGEELLVWGGREAIDGPPLASGLRYVPADDEWRALPTAPLPGGPSTGALAEDGTFVVVNQDPTSGALHVASWDGDAWQELPTGAARPERWGVDAATSDAVWAQGALVLPQAGVVLDGSLTWQELPAPPVELTESHAVAAGDGIVAVAGRTGAPGTLAGDVELLLLDVADGSWQRAEPGPLRAQAIDVAWTGDELLVASYEGDTATYDPSSGSWQEGADLPLDTGECSPDATTFGSGSSGVLPAVALCGRLALRDGANGWWPLAGPGGMPFVTDVEGTAGGLVATTIDVEGADRAASAWFLRVEVEGGTARLTPEVGALAVGDLTWPLPEGARVVTTSVEGESLVRTISVGVLFADGPCRLSSTYAGTLSGIDQQLAVDGAEAVRLELAGGRTVDAAAVPAGALDDEAHLFWVLPERSNLDEVTCSDLDQAERVAADLQAPG